MDINRVFLLFGLTIVIDLKRTASQTSPPESTTAEGTGSSVVPTAVAGTSGDGNGITRIVHARFDLQWVENYYYQTGRNEFERTVIDPGCEALRDSNLFICTILEMEEGSVVTTFEIRFADNATNNQITSVMANLQTQMNTGMFGGATVLLYGTGRYSSNEVSYSNSTVCGTTTIAIDSGISTIFSPNYPFSYPNNAACKYVIEYAENYQTEINFYSFDLEGKDPNQECTYDYVQIYEGNANKGRYCGSTKPFQGESRYFTDDVSIEFISDISYTNQGFVVSVYWASVNPNIATSTSTTPQPGTMFYCANINLWIEISKVCNSVDDCGDGSDESTLNGCQAPFECSDGSETIRANLKCNGNRDCDDGSDESPHAPASCNLNNQNFQCADGSRVIPPDHLCDGVQDCDDRSDESNTYAGCTTNPCDSNPCLNGGSCVGEAGSANYSCSCTNQWEGDRCQTDADNDCSSSPCQNNGDCFDASYGYFCLCGAGFINSDGEQDCAIDVGTYTPVDGSRVMFVNSSGVNSGTCGALNDPCASLEYALGRNPRTQTRVIRLSASTTPYSLPEFFWIPSNVIFDGNRGFNENGELVVLNLNKVIIARRNAETINVEFIKVSLESSYLYVGQAEVVFEQSKVTDSTVQLEYMRRADSEFIKYIFEDSIVTNSDILTLPSHSNEVQTSAGGNEYVLLYWNLGTAKMDILSGCEFISSLVNLTASILEVEIADTSFTHLTNITRSFTGVHLQSGENFREDTTTARRKKRSVGFGEDYYHYPPEELDINFRRLPLHERQLKRQKRNTKSTTNTVTDTIFMKTIKVNNQDRLDILGQAAISMELKNNFTLTIEDCSFTNNERALNLAFIGGTQGTIRIERSNFTDNIASGPGGAVQLEQTQGSTTFAVEDCNFYNNLAKFAQADGDEIVPVSKLTGSGGAIAVNLRPSETQTTTLSSTFELNSCTFVNNTATSYGGTVYITPGVVTTVEACQFQNTDLSTTTNRPNIGDVLESRGSLYLRSSVFNIATARDTTSVLAYRADKDSSFMQVENTSFTCPNGFTADTVSNALQSGGRDQIESMLVFCNACSKGLYTLDQSKINLDGLNVTVLQQVTCIACPYGASCDVEEPYSKANFWGDVYVDSSDLIAKIDMLICPEGYCCQSETCPDFKQCNTNRNRNIPMCGECTEGYSESLFSTDCIKNEDCNTATWFWMVIALYGIGYVCLFVFEEEIRQVVHSFSDYFRDKFYACRRRIGSSRSKGDDENTRQNQQQTQQQNQPGPADENDPNRIAAFYNNEDDEESALLTIFMYYVQVPSLLKIDILYQGNRDPPLSTLTKTLKNVFSFNTFGTGLNTCLFHDTTAVFKTWARTIFVFYLFGVLIIFFIIGKLLRQCLVSCGKFNPQLKVSKDRKQQLRQLNLLRPGFQWPIPQHLNAHFCGALILLLLYTYQYFAENAFKLVKCVDVKSFDKSLLFIDANVECYQDWQYGVFVFAVVYVFPFFMAILLAPVLVKRRIVSIKVFVISILLPLFSVPALLYLYLRMRNRDKMDRRRARAGMPMLDQEELRRRQKLEDRKRVKEDGGEAMGGVKTVVGIMMDPYRKQLAGGLCWEGVISLQRLLLVVFATLIGNVLIRHVFLVITCLISMVIHNKVRPFVRMSNNILMSIALLILTFISIMNLVKASYFESGTIPDATADTVLQGYDWVEVVLLGFIPIAIIGFGVIAVLIRIIALISKRCRPKKHKRQVPPHQGYQHPYGQTSVGQNQTPGYGDQTQGNNTNQNVPPSFHNNGHPPARYPAPYQQQMGYGGNPNLSYQPNYPGTIQPTAHYGYPNGYQQSGYQNGYGQQRRPRSNHYDNNMNPERHRHSGHSSQYSRKHKRPKSRNEQYDGNRYPDDIDLDLTGKKYRPRWYP